MRLMLIRRYTQRATLGRLYLGNRQLCLVREAPKACFGAGTQCLEEGVYELQPEHSESEGWSLRVGESGKVCSRSVRQPLGTGDISPVSSYRADGTPLFTRLAFLKLVDELGQYWERGEVLELQIVSDGIPYRRPSCRTASCS